MPRPLLLCVFAIVLQGAIAGLSAQRDSGQALSPRQPLPTAAPWPLGLERNLRLGIEGSVRLMVQVERGSVVHVGLVGEAAPYLAAPIIDAISKWQFAPDVTTVLETTVRRSLAGDTGCGLDQNQTILARLPESIEVVSRKFVMACDPTIARIERREPLSRVSGRLICDCPSRDPLRSVRLNVYSDPRAEGSAIRTLLTDTDGTFRITGLRPGAYRLEIRQPGFEFTDYRFVVALGGDASPFDAQIAPRPEPARVPQVVSGSIPVYPSAALATGIQGVVNVRLSLDGNTVLDIDADSAHPELAAAAVANVRTWKFRETTVPVLSIGFTYVIDQGDCKQPVNPLITMKLPDSVTIRAVRPCQGDLGKTLLTRPKRSMPSL